MECRQHFILFDSGIIIGPRKIGYSITKMATVLRLFFSEREEGGSGASIYISITGNPDKHQWRIKRLKAHGVGESHDCWRPTIMTTF